MYSVQISHNFSSMDEAERVVKALIEFLRYQTQKRNVFFQALIGISQYDSKSIDTIVNEKK